MSYISSAAPKAEAKATPSNVPQPPLYDARALTQNGQLAQIHLDGQLYTLRITKAGKLILTK